MIKRVFYLFALIATLSGYAQRADNAIALQAKAGIMEGKGEIIKDIASTASFGVQYFAGHRGFLIEGNAFMQDFSINHQDLGKTLPYSLYGINLMGGWSFERLNPLFLGIKLGGFAGYYTVNKGDEREDVYNTVLENDVKGITYGALASAEVEIAIWKRLSGVVSFSQYFYPKDKWIRWNYGAKAGFKVYL